MNSETLIVGIGCLFLATTFFLFRSQILIWLGRLAKTEFHVGENQWVHTETVTPRDTKPWNWYEAWMNALLHPNADTWNILLFQKRISFIKTYVWVTITSLLFPLVSSVVTWIKFPLATTTSSIVGFIKNILLIGVLEPVWFIIITGTIHLLVKLISSKGNFRNFFVIFATSFAPISCLYTLMALIRWSFAFKIGLYAGLLLDFYFITFVFTEIIVFNYQVNRLAALLVNVVIVVLVVCQT